MIFCLFSPYFRCYVKVFWSWPYERALPSPAADLPESLPRALSPLSLGGSMAHLLESGEFSDAVLIARGGVAFRCHRNILAAR